jgi:urate oxidase/2-oxo-4-hydroxy-4-carboxy-5-ureidoimidazoline decarboxylase
MEQFASGWKRNYYGKGDVIVYRLHRGDRSPSGGPNPVFGASVLMLLYGDAFWPTYTEGDNRNLIATDSMKNFIQRQTQDYAGNDLEDYCWFLGATFLDTYPQVEGIQVSAVEIPFGGLEHGVGFAPSGQERATARIELQKRTVVEVVSGLRGFRLLRLGGSAFRGFVRDEYTTLPDLLDRPLHLWLDLEWSYTSPDHACSEGRITAQVRRIVHDVFEGFESGSIQQVIYQMGTRVLSEIPSIQEVHLEANNRTWDTISERSGEGGIYTDPRPPYGCLGLRLRR